MGRRRSKNVQQNMIFLSIVMVAIFLVVSVSLMAITNLQTPGGEFKKPQQISTLRQAIIPKEVSDPLQDFLALGSDGTSPEKEAFIKAMEEGI